MSVTPDFIGQRYKDTNTGNIWIANSTTPGDWTLEVQNMQVMWTPISIKGAESAGFSITVDSGITALTVLSSSCATGFEIKFHTSIATISFPNLVTCGTYGVEITGCSALSSLLAPNLVTPNYLLIINCASLTQVNWPLAAWGVLDSGIDIENNNQLSSLSFPSIGSPSAIFIKGNQALTSLNISGFIPTIGGDYEFTGNALTATAINAILALGVASAGFTSGILDLSGGTNATPTGQGIIDKAILIGRGVTLTTN